MQQLNGTSQTFCKVTRLEKETNCSRWVRILVIVTLETNHHNVAQIVVQIYPKVQLCKNYTVRRRSKVGTNKAATNNFIFEFPPFLLCETDVLTEFFFEWRQVHVTLVS